MWVRGASWQRWPQKRRWWTCSTSSKTRQWRQHITWNWNRLFGLLPVTASTSLFVVVDYSAICSGDPCLVGCPPYERRKLQVELRGIFSIFPDCPQIVKPLVYIPLEHNWQEHFLWSVSESLERLRPIDQTPGIPGSGEKSTLNFWQLFNEFKLSCPLVTGEIPQERFTEDQVDIEGKDGRCLIKKAQSKLVVP